MSHYYRKGEIVNQDSGKAIKLLEKAIALGLPEAMFNLANMYLDGTYVSPDIAKAIELSTQRRLKANKA